eukprot:CAMPEP_0174916990 /NCGR_PEP_ID=MMETSP1355-20121228/2193_1 /TAXON_ID=464990 /ORGANISM="Hemiselmis tepida, Strain CCMP443" /LENGTH=42 /DNA_ID= /DNA_START= /DNA_END= /DNA_ORIENTATION=
MAALGALTPAQGIEAASPLLPSRGDAEAVVRHWAAKRGEKGR